MSTKTFAARLAHPFQRWFDSHAGLGAITQTDPQRVDWVRCAPFIALHVACLGVLLVGWSPFALIWALGLYLVRMFAITGFYHRYFSHRTFRTSRAAQFIFAVLGNSSAQRGPLWWAAHHRNHHKHSDTEDDVHSAEKHGFLWSHMGWIMSRPNFLTQLEHVPDLVKYPELRFLDRFDTLVPFLLIGGSCALGAVLSAFAPELGTGALQLGIWTVISTVILFHATCTINSLSHMFGSRRFETTDRSRNNPLLAILTLGEGWHNNHHYFARSARQGFYWWEYDITYYGLVVMSWLGIVWDLKPVPAQILAKGRRRRR
jgi:stearoyl-CoA desaturase (Delta-9 desaturase)